LPDPIDESVFVIVVVICSSSIITFLVSVFEEGLSTCTSFKALSRVCLCCCFPPTEIPLPAPPPALEVDSDSLPPPAVVPVPVDDCPPIPMFCLGSIFPRTPRAATLLVSVSVFDPLSALAADSPPPPPFLLAPSFFFPPSSALPFDSEPAPDFEVAPASDSSPPFPETKC